MEEERVTEDSSLENLVPENELDLRGIICPYNFVKTKLMLETMLSGQVLAVILDEGEPIRNVPDSIRHEEHKILRQEPFAGAVKLFIRTRDEK